MATTGHSRLHLIWLTYFGQQPKWCRKHRCFAKATLVWSQPARLAIHECLAVKFFEFQLMVAPPNLGLPRLHLLGWSVKISYCYYCYWYRSSAIIMDHCWFMRFLRYCFSFFTHVIQIPDPWCGLSRWEMFVHYRAAGWKGLLYAIVWLQRPWCTPISWLFSNQQCC